MKITDHDRLKSSEREMIDAITGDLDWGAIERLFQEKYNLKLRDDVVYKNGDMVIHNNQIAYELNFDVTLSFSVLFDRKGECLKVTAKEETAQPPEAAVPENSASGTPDPNDQASQLASDLADMISDINKD